MTGFIRGLFRGKPNPQVEAPVQNGTLSAQQGAYYLPPDDAMTMGDIEYMRSAKSIRRSFPKGKLGVDNEYVQSVSALAKSNGSAVTLAQIAAASNAVPDVEVAKRRQADTSMDLFRNMAREMKKR